MKEVINLFLTDFRMFVRDNTAVLSISLPVIIGLHLLGKGSWVINTLVLLVHISGDVLMVMGMEQYARKQKKSGSLYMLLSGMFFVIVGATAVVQSQDGKNWQYILGTIPFFIAYAYQILDAWEKPGKELFNWFMTMVVCCILASVYYSLDLVYAHAWVFIVGYSVFPIVLALPKTATTYVWTLVAVAVMILGVTIDIYVQLQVSPQLPAASISSFFITGIALIGFSRSAGHYLKGLNPEQVVLIWILTKVNAMQRFL
ncbi:MAG: hypothetical protein H6767_03290 [Candidatus Peribacteria bacterium]|nr:MAG: hypothetical protein H6767_03290 [Candidatus Peribacteria bacterium]